ncbi:hypothetical protein [Polymorphobacter sp. PAMC 29334]|uniref:hypothetical protein n=1 Tax=Polymorphobacter sp. PAMC 29334 TaxID=2862331 RepID=UPI001D019F0A|nr:hypothetical protein [Polymorphobacter sp. PAMC 29334]
MTGVISLVVQHARKVLLFGVVYVRSNLSAHAGDLSGQTVETVPIWRDVGRRRRFVLA